MAKRAPQGRAHWQTGPFSEELIAGLDVANENYYHLASSCREWQAEEIKGVVNERASAMICSAPPPLDGKEEHVRRVKAVMRALHLYSQKLAEPDAHILTNALLNLAVQRLLTEVSREDAVQILSRLTGAVSVDHPAPAAHTPIDLAHLNS